MSNIKRLMEDYTDALGVTDYRRARQEVVVQFIGLIIAAVAVTLTLIWFGWKFLLVVFLLMFSNNISRRKHR